MRQNPLPALPQDIEDVRLRIELWRQTRPKLLPMPQELWQAAASLTAKHSLCRVAQALRLNHSALKMHVLQASSPRDNRQDDAVAFIEWPAPAVFPASAPAESVVELVGHDGARVTVRLPASQPVDLVGLANSFWRRLS